MNCHILTIFPAAFDSFLQASLLGKAHKRGLLQTRLWDIRDFATDKHHQVDDVPYGGGQGMVMKPEPIVRTLEAAFAVEPDAWRILLTPRGKVLSQARLARLAQESALVMLCGRYEGVDERVSAYLDEEISIGDYVLAGGEAAALVLLDGVSRLIPGVLGNADSVEDETFSSGLLEYPQYTRPPEFRGQAVPDVLLSGDHERIRRWRRKEALLLTRQRRPDLFACLSLALSEEDRRLLDEVSE